jgi:peptidoglycan/xylan/chitin deacetylase (PgdA/CDA1 family)
LIPQLATSFLIYHELEAPGRPLCRSDAGYVRYVVFVNVFREQLQCLRQLGLRGISVGGALRFEDPHAVAITFDDGCESDLLVAAPLLHDSGFNATFYAVAGWIGKPGFLSRSQLQELSDAGFEIGCHSMTHAYLSHLDEAGLHREIADAKVCLEQLIGKPVTHFSCPGGRLSRDAVRVAKEARFLSVATSCLVRNNPASDRYRLGRLGVMRSTTVHSFERLCRDDKVLRRLRYRDYLKSWAKLVLGDSTYDQIRAKLLARPH